MNAELDKANANLKEKQDQLNEILDKVAALKATLEATLAEKKQLEDDTALTQGRLQRAEKLTVGLADEHVRWQETVSTLDEKILNLIGDVFISAACISLLWTFHWHVQNGDGSRMGCWLRRFENTDIRRL